jgi:DNA-binding transcriptional LysR family regulator
VADRFDAGVRLGDTIDKDMIAVPIGPPLRMAVVATPTLHRAIPKNPRDLMDHNCINQRMQTSGRLYVWDFERRVMNVRVNGQLTFNTSVHIVAALAGLGIAYLPEEEFSPHLQEGRLMRVLEDWCPPSLDTICTTPADGNPLRRFRLFPMRCARASKGAKAPVQYMDRAEACRPTVEPLSAGGSAHF